MPGFLIGNDRVAFDGETPLVHHSNRDFCSLFFFQGLMEIRSVSVGVVAIKSVSTGLYLAMTKKGTLFGSVSASVDIIENLSSIIKK